MPENEIIIRDNQEYCLLEKEQFEDMVMQADAFKNIQSYYLKFKLYLEALKEVYSLEKKEVIVDKQILYAINKEDKGKLNMLSLDYDLTGQDVFNMAREITRTETIITTLHNLLHPEEALLNGPLLKNVQKPNNDINNNKDPRRDRKSVAGS